jgi:drug/metabolite transporter (DMT)-like permease
MLGVVFSILSAAAFALNNATVRRGVVTGTPSQAMAITIPMGIACFLPFVFLLGGFSQLSQFPLQAVAWMASFGVLHFVFGRFCNFKANQVAGVNLTAPVVQLQVVVTMVLAVIILGEPCTALQMIGGVIMLAGSLITQRQAPRVRAAGIAPASKPALPVFAPRYLAGYLFASLAALAYGTSPILARTALGNTGPITGILGGLIAYCSATAVASLALIAAPVRRNITALSRGNAGWFVSSGVLVAAAQGFFFCAIALAPVLLVMPLMQLSLAFRLLFSTWLSPDHEVFGMLVAVGAGVSIFGAMLVSIDTGLILDTLAIPDAIGQVLRWRVG